jgi:16S rRNA (cytidine1402-2'-O)-methyltransferase
VLDEVAGLRATLVIYESARRLGATLADLEAALGPRRAVVARELTKMHEEFVRGSLPELAEQYRDEPPLGEVVVLLEGRTEAERWSEAEVLAAIHTGLERGERLKTLSTEIAKQAGWTSAEVYRLGTRRPR